jgi:transposase
VLLAEQGGWVQRMQKAVVQMNLQLTEVLTDVMGMTGQAIVRVIVAGERDPKALPQHRHGRVKASSGRDRASAGKSGIASRRIFATWGSTTSCVTACQLAESET